MSCGACERARKYLPRTLADQLRELEERRRLKLEARERRFRPGPHAHEMTGPERKG